MFTRGLSPARPGVRRGPRVIDLDMVAVGQWGTPIGALGSRFWRDFTVENVAIFGDFWPKHAGNYEIHDVSFGDDLRKREI